MDCIVHGVTKSQTQLSDFHFHFHFHFQSLSYLIGKFASLLPGIANHYFGIFEVWPLGH